MTIWATYGDSEKSGNSFEYGDLHEYGDSGKSCDSIESCLEKTVLTDIVMDQSNTSKGTFVSDQIRICHGKVNNQRLQSKATQ